MKIAVLLKQVPDLAEELEEVLTEGTRSKREQKLERELKELRAKIDQDKDKEVARAVDQASLEVDQALCDNFDYQLVSWVYLGCFEFFLDPIGAISKH